MENNAPGRGKLKVTGIIYTVLGALSILGSCLFWGPAACCLPVITMWVWSWGPRAGVFSVLGAVSGVFYLVIGILGIRNCGRPENCRGQLCAWGDCAGAGGDRAGGQCGRVRPHRCGVQCGGTGAVHPLPPGRQAESGRMESGPIMKPLHGKTVCPAWDTVFLSPGRGVDFLGKGWYNTLVCDAADSAGQYPAAKDVTDETAGD